MTARRAIVVDGTVQGVGFRPFVYGLASHFGLSGFVRNRTGSVFIEIEGRPDLLDAFVAALTASPPPLARIDAVRAIALAPRGGHGFGIEPSEAVAGDAPRLPPEVATCAECLAELFDTRGRRHRYPFVNCTNCGPRFTIVIQAPYDRARTSMAGFAMCAACAAEYDDPRDRRFHAQPIACPACGPRLHALDGGRRVAEGEAALARAVAALRAGGIVAVKGLGGYHLACDAASDTAVCELRRRKGREAKPFAVMVADEAEAERLAVVTPVERALLSSPARPIVLLPRRPGRGVADAVAPGAGLLGVMLPYTPLHHLLLRDAGVGPLVMTSGNRSEEPIVIDDEEARRDLGAIADLILAHDRPIHARADDSVVRAAAGRPLPVRRSRGLVPAPLGLPRPLAMPTLAVGGHLKATFALGEATSAVPSQHLGDLDAYAAVRAFEAAVEHFEGLFGIRPRRLVHDLHPDYASTRYALARAAAAGLPTLAVQHHHAHLAACLADNGADEPVIGVCFDGAGLGTDGAIWGGEFLVGDARAVVRAAHLRYVGLPGGERAIREPWRMAVAHLAQAGLDPAAAPLVARVPARDRRVVELMLSRHVNTPPTSSVGRLFDAAAALVGLATHNRFEGEAAMALEALALDGDDDAPYPFDVGGSDPTNPLIVDPAPIVRAVLRDATDGVAATRIARRFHATVAEIVRVVCRRLRADGAPSTVALGGGVFVNAVLAADACRRLADDGFHVYRHRGVPPNDGGLCLGQLAVAAARDAAETA